MRGARVCPGRGRFDEKPGETGGPTRATRVDSEGGRATFQSPQPDEQAALLQYPCGRTAGEDDHGPAAVASPASPLPPRNPRPST